MEVTKSVISLGSPLEELNNNSKAWVYTAVTPFNEHDIEKIKDLSQTFLGQWESHGKKVLGTIQIIENRFIAIFADPQDDTMCGRAQDASVRLIKELEEEIDTPLMDRMQVAYEIDNTIKVNHFNELKSKIEDGVVPTNTYFYNGLIQNKSEFFTNWRRPIEGSWLA